MVVVVGRPEFHFAELEAEGELAGLQAGFEVFDADVDVLDLDLEHAEDELLEGFDNESLKMMERLSTSS